MSYIASVMDTDKPSPKEFALSAISPYYKDPSTCGYSKETLRCVYLTKDGRSCVAGKYMLHPEKYDIGATTGIAGILLSETQEQVFKPEAVGILTMRQWDKLQIMHDVIVCANHAHYSPEETNSELKQACNKLDLFTLDELKQYSETH